MIAEHVNNFTLNQKLFNKIKFVYDNRAKKTYDLSDIRLVEEIYTYFKRNGAELDENKKKELRRIDKILSSLSPKFSKNVLTAQNNFELFAL